jgi:hypothetical protein
MALDPTAVVETYLGELANRRRTGAARPETSYYTPLENLLDAVGAALKPKVFCVGQLADLGGGVGSPDFGLFTQAQVQRGQPRDGAAPERGVVEVKSPADDAFLTAASAQVSRYWGRYRLVLVTNYRGFLLLGADAAGNPARLEAFSLAATEAEFWGLAERPREAAARLGRPLAEYLTRALTHKAALAEPRDVAWHLASYARDALARVEAKPGLPALVQVKKALEQALGVAFEAERGLHFFRSTLVQTLFYGLFSAWVLWAREHAPRGERFGWREAHWYLKVPMLSALFAQLAQPGRLGPLGLVEVLDWAQAALDRVDRAAFFARFEEGEAVQYFYEPFLAAFDPELRKQLGVWYTPREVVRYMVERVDRALRDELGIADGLADERVHVLDPCCGTGAFLVEVLRRIDRTLADRGLGAMKGARVKRAALARVNGFEIMPAPFVVAHLQVGLLLQQLQAPLADEREGGGVEERARVYLTNALTGWGGEAGRQIEAFPEFAAERELAAQVKRKAPILVVLGNPPYNAFAGTSPEEEEGLVEPYKAGLQRRWGIRKFNLDELYVRFLRVAERRIVEGTGRGVVCYVSSYSYLSDPSFVVAREHLLRGFDRIWIDSLNGDSRETGKLTPTGEPDPSVFSTESNREGIRLGTAVGLLVRTGAAADAPPPVVRYRDFWGAAKRADLLASLDAPEGERPYAMAEPSPANRFSFRPHSAVPGHASWASLPALSGGEPFSGLTEMRQHALIDIDRDTLEARMRRYLDPAVPWTALESECCGPVQPAARFDPRAAREALLAQEGFRPDAIRRFAFMPSDTRWCYHTSVRPVWNEPRPALVEHARPGNRFVTTRMAARRPGEDALVSVTSALPNYHLFDPNTRAIPLRLFAAGLLAGGRDGDDPGRANLSTAARRYLAALGAPDPDRDPATGEAVWLHALAVAHAPAYARENAEALLRDWPRVPLPSNLAALQASAALGSTLAALLDPDTTALGVTAGAVRPELRDIAVPSRTGSGQLGADERALTAGWGYENQQGAVMPGQGRAAERPYRPDELDALASAAGGPDEARALLGDSTFDVWLNDTAFWSNIPARVWRYRLGGYQVVKKWLSYREKGVLGRPLRDEEILHVQATARRIAAILLMGPALDRNYEAAKADPYPWPGS